MAGIRPHSDRKDERLPAAEAKLNRRSRDTRPSGRMSEDFAHRRAPGKQIIVLKLGSGKTAKMVSPTGFEPVTR
jgi:hypothetical protein